MEHTLVPWTYTWTGQLEHLFGTEPVTKETCGDMAASTFKATRDLEYVLIPIFLSWLEYPLGRGSGAKEERLSTYAYCVHALAATLDPRPSTLDRLSVSLGTDIGSDLSFMQTSWLWSRCHSVWSSLSVWLSLWIVQYCDQNGWEVMNRMVMIPICVLNFDQCDFDQSLLIATTTEMTMLTAALTATAFLTTIFRGFQTVASSNPRADYSPLLIWTTMMIPGVSLSQSLLIAGGLAID